MKMKNPSAVVNLLLVASLGASVTFASPPGRNDRPIIGIQSQESPESLQQFGQTYIPASYVEFVELAGGRVVPILTNQTDSYYTNLFNSLNGVLWPGGGLDAALLVSQYGQIGKKFFDLAIKSNMKGDYFPIWGTCQGLQLMASLAAGEDIVTDLAAVKENKNITLEKGYKNSLLFGGAPDWVIDALETKAVTYNFHYYSVTRRNFTRFTGLSDMFSIMSTTQNDAGRVFISSMEAKKFPFYAVQFHPEKPIFEWSLNRNIKHDATSVMVSQYFTNFFVSEARKSDHKFATDQEEMDALIHNYNVTYTRGTYGLTQAYFFYP